MGNYTGGVNTICPYYSHESDKTITCEGMIDETVVMSRFMDNDSKTMWQYNVCSTYKYGSCPIANINNKRYEEMSYEEVILPKKKYIKKEIQNEVKFKEQLPGQMSIKDFLGGSLCKK